MDPPLDLSGGPIWTPVAAAAAAAGVGVEPPAPAGAAAAAGAMDSTEPPTAWLAAAIRQSVLPCRTCRTSRVKCVGGFPCDRCFDLGHTCVPGLGIEVAGRGRKRPKGSGDSAAEEGLAVVAAAPSPMDLAYLSSDPLPFAELYARACVRVFEEGQCSRASILRFLRKWRRESLRSGADVTMGVGKILQERAGIAPIELVDSDELMYGPTEAARRARLMVEQTAQAGRRRELLEWDVYKRASLGGAAAYCICVDAYGRHVDVANAAFLQLVGGAGWPGRHMQACKMLACYLGASLCAPADRQTFLKAIADHCLGDVSGTRRITHVFKMYLADGSDRGHVGLVIATLEHVTLEGGAIGLVMRLEPAPPSRHLTARPSSPEAARPLRKGRPAQRRYKKGYRQSTLADAMTAAATGLGELAGAAAPPAAGREQQAHGPGVFAFPAMAVVPGVALPAGGAGAFLDAAAEALFARRARQEEEQASSVPPGVRRRTRRRRAAAAGVSSGGGASEAGGAGDRAHMAPASPEQPLAPLALLAIEQEQHAHDGPFSLDSEDWPGFLEDLDIGPSPIPMETVFADG